jgi:hypothetical protein
MIPQLMMMMMMALLAVLYCPERLFPESVCEHRDICKLGTLLQFLPPSYFLFCFCLFVQISVFASIARRGAMKPVLLYTNLERSEFCDKLVQ